MNLNGQPSDKDKAAETPEFKYVFSGPSLSDDDQNDFVQGDSPQKQQSGSPLPLLSISES